MLHPSSSFEIGSAAEVRRERSGGGGTGTGSMSSVGSSSSSSSSSCSSSLSSSSSSSSLSNRTRLSPVGTSTSQSGKISSSTTISSFYTHSSSSLTSLHSMSLASSSSEPNSPNLAYEGMIARRNSLPTLGPSSRARRLSVDSRFDGGEGGGDSSAERESSSESSGEDIDPCGPVAIIGVVTTPTKDDTSGDTPNTGSAVQRTASTVKVSPSAVRAITSAGVGRSASSLDSEASMSTLQIPASDSYTRFRPDTPPKALPPQPKGFQRFKMSVATRLSGCHFLPLLAGLIYLTLLFGSLLLPQLLEHETQRTSSGVSPFGSLTLFLAPSLVYSPFLPTSAQNQLRLDLKNIRCSRWMETWWPNQDWKSTLILNGAQPSMLSEYARSSMGEADAGGATPPVGLGGFLFARAASSSEPSYQQYEQHYPEYPQQQHHSQQPHHDHATIPTLHDLDPDHHPLQHHLHAEPTRIIPATPTHVEQHGGQMSEQEYQRFIQQQQQHHQQQQQQQYQQQYLHQQQQQHHQAHPYGHAQYHDPYTTGHSNVDVPHLSHQQQQFYDPYASDGGVHHQQPYTGDDHTYSHHPSTQQHHTQQELLQHQQHQQQLYQHQPTSNQHYNQQLHPQHHPHQQLVLDPYLNGAPYHDQAAGFHHLSSHEPSTSNLDPHLRPPAPSSSVGEVETKLKERRTKMIEEENHHNERVRQEQPRQQHEQQHQQQHSEDSSATGSISSASPPPDSDSTGITSDPLSSAIGSASSDSSIATPPPPPSPSPPSSAPLEDSSSLTAMLRHRRERERIAALDEKSVGGEEEKQRKTIEATRHTTTTVESIPTPQPPTPPPPPPPSHSPTYSMHSPPNHFGAFRLTPLIFYVSCGLTMLILPWVSILLVLGNLVISCMILLNLWWSQRQAQRAAIRARQTHNGGSAGSGGDDEKSLVRFVFGKCCWKRCQRKRQVGGGGGTTNVHTLAPPPSRPLPTISLTHHASLSELVSNTWCWSLAYCCVAGFPAFLLKRRIEEQAKRGKKGL